MLRILGPTKGIFLNALFYLPLIIWLVRAPYGRHYRGDAPPPKRAVRGIADIVATVRDVRGIPILISLIVLAGAASFSSSATAIRRRCRILRPTSAMPTPE